MSVRICLTLDSETLDAHESENRDALVHYMPNHFRLGFWMFRARPDDREVWKKLDQRWFRPRAFRKRLKRRGLDVSLGEKRKTTHEPLKMSIPFYGLDIVKDSRFQITLEGYPTNVVSENVDHTLVVNLSRLAAESPHISGRRCRKICVEVGVLCENKAALVREMAEIPKNFWQVRGITERI